MTKQPPCAQTQGECSNGSRGGQLQTKTSLGGRVQRGNHIQPIPRSLFYPATMSSGATGPRTFVLDCPQLITPPLLSNVYPPPRIPAILVLALPSSLAVVTGLRSNSKVEPPSDSHPPAIPFEHTRLCWRLSHIVHDFCKLIFILMTR